MVCLRLANESEGGTMASQPGPLTQWPWQKLGNMKYAILFPWAAHSMYKVIMCDDKNLLNLTILPTLLLRLLHTQLWITLSRFQTAKGKHRIVTKSLEFEQVDRERNWDDQILLTALLFYMGGAVLPGTRNLPWWNTKGALFTILLHAGPVEFLYYWFHRALHHHFLYSRYHSHHHASIVTEPITSVIHPFAEEMVYFMLFAIPMFTMLLTGMGSIIAAVGYLIYIDFMNYMGHCNFELVPKLMFHVFPPLKYLMYTPSFHSLHHTQFRTNYSLFMPLYDCIYGTIDASTDGLYEESLNGKEEVPNVIHLTHLTSLQSIYHLRFGFASLASKQYAAKWYLWIMWPLTFMWTRLMCLCRTTFTVEKHRLKELHIETWAVPRYSFQYTSKSGREEINGMIEKAILEAEGRGTKVMSLGLLNQDERLNEYGSLYLRKNPKLKMKIIDGTSLAVAVVLNSIPRGTKEVLLVGNISKMAYILALSLCQKGVQVVTIQRDQYQLLKLKLSSEICKHLVFSKSYSNKIWLVGDGLSEKDQMKAAKGVHIIPFSQFPPKMMRRDCIYHSTPALKVPKVYENLHTCENWLPRRVMSAWRVAGIVHALEEWDEHECGDTTADIKKVWDATLEHGFLPNEHL